MFEVLQTISSLDVIGKLNPKAWCKGTEGSVPKPFLISVWYMFLVFVSQCCKDSNENKEV